jgi:hypothetical protein
VELDVASNWSVRAAKESLSLVTGVGLFFLPVSLWMFVAGDSSSLSRMKPLMQPPTRYVVATALLLLSINFIRLAVTLRRGNPLLRVSDGVVEVQTAFRRRRFAATSITGVRVSETGVGLVIDIAGCRPVRVGFEPEDLTWDQVAERLTPR